MKKMAGMFGFLILLGIGLVFGLNSMPDRPSGQQQFVAGEALVKFKPHVSSEEAARLLSAEGISIEEEIQPLGIYRVSFPKSVSSEELIGRLKQMPQVAYAEPHGVMQAVGWDSFGASEAWAEESKGPLGAGAKVRVAVIDTAIDSTHPDLATKMVGGFNFVNNTANTQSSGVGTDWHGTASTGRILNGAGDANIEIMPVTVLGSNGSGTWANVIKGVTYAADNGAQVINLSLGGTGYSQALQDAITYAVNKGVVVVAAAGNTGADQAFFPASYQGVISVASTNEAGKKSGFSTFHSSVDLSAPGDPQKLLSHGGYRQSQGTSFAAPFIAGMAAMLKSAFPFLTGPQVEQVMKAKASDLAGKNDPRFDGKMGAGFLNALDVGKWMADIRAGNFRFPWQAAPPAPPAAQPPGPGPAQPAQPWLARSRGNGGTYVITPAGEVVKE